MVSDLSEEQEVTQDPSDLSEDSAASADLQSVSDPPNDMNDMDRTQEVLRAIAETQRALATGREGSGRRKWAQIRSEEYSCAGTTIEDEMWKRSKSQIECFQELSDFELTLFMMSRVQRSAKDSLDINDIT